LTSTGEARPFAGIVEQLLFWCSVTLMRIRSGLGAWLLVGTIFLGGCGSLKEGLEDSKRTTAALKSELGFDAQVYFRTANGHTSVTVQLASPPSGDAATAKHNIEDVVNRNFRAKVERVDVSF